jgi:hypothetical protein
MPSITLLIMDYIAGRDIFFTSGPLGFLIFPADVSNNLMISFIFQGILWLTFIAGLSTVVLKEEIPLSNLIVFTTCFCLSISLGYFEYYFSFMTLFFLGLYVAYPRKFYFFMIFVVLFITGSFIRFSMLLFLLPSLVITAIYMATSKEHKDLRPVYIALATLFIILPLSILLITSSFDASLLYLKATSHIISNYSVAMGGLGISSGYFIYYAIGVLVLYMVFAIHLYKTKNTRFYLTLVFLPAIGFLFKHSVVLNHYNLTRVFFPTFTALIGTILLFTDFKIHGKKLYPAVIISGIILFPVMYTQIVGTKDSYPQLTPQWAVSRLTDAVNLKKTQLIIRNHKKQNLADLKLPDEIRKTIGNSGVSIMPWELSIAAANDLNYVPLPVFQTYSAYTPFLDDLNASSLTDFDNPRRSPDYIIIQMRYLDGKHPLVDVPSTWRTIYKWYDTSFFNDKFLVLLHKRQYPRYESIRSISKLTCNINDTVPVPDSPHPVIVKINMELDFWGKIRKSLYRIPCVNLTLICKQNRQYTYRTIPDNLSNGVFINHLPLTEEDVFLLTTKNQAINKFTAFKISGKGSKYYKDEITIEFMEIPEITISRYTGK